MSDHPEPEIRDIPLAHLTVDPEVQRGLDKIRVDKLVADYRSDALGVIVVSDRGDGTHHVIDGQHRVAATQAAGYGDRAVKCLVYKGLDLAEEAAMFRRLNNSRAVQALDKFRVRVIEGDPVAVRLNTMLERNGWRVLQSKDDGAFAAVHALETVYRGTRGGPTENIEVCEKLIAVVSAAWDHDADGVRSEVLMGLGAVLTRHQHEVDIPKLVAELGQFTGGPRGLIGRAKSLRDIRGGRVSDAFAEIVVNLLNRRRRSNLLPDWRSGGDR